jgi:hypothetical protein
MELFNQVELANWIAVAISLVAIYLSYRAKKDAKRALKVQLHESSIRYILQLSCKYSGTLSDGSPARATPTQHENKHLELQVINSGKNVAVFESIVLECDCEDRDIQFQGYKFPLRVLDEALTLACAVDDHMSLEKLSYRVVIRTAHGCTHSFDSNQIRHAVKTGVVISQHHQKIVA